MPSFYEFFAGGGMARAGLGTAWECLFANDLDPMKARVYRANWGDRDLLCEDVAKVRTSDLPGIADLIWGSFPCQDLSLAGDYQGLGRRGANLATRSGSFWPFWSLVEELVREGRAPKVVVLENVPGVLSSGGGRDFAAIGQTLVAAGYRFGAVVMDARWFLPQSRPRVVVIAVRKECELPPHLIAKTPDERWAPSMLLAAFRRLPPSAAACWLWWNVPRPEISPMRFDELVEDEPSDVPWHSADQTKRLLDSMSPLNRRKVDTATRAGRRVVGTLYRRTRPNRDGTRQVRAEVRFDDVAGCLRTPSGGSSRQNLLIVDGRTIRSRLLSGREAARLMGLDDNYRLPERYNDAYHVAGDGVAVPVVRHLAQSIFEPLVRANGRPAAVAAE